MGFFEDISVYIREGRVKNQDQLQSLKLRLAKKYSLEHIPKNSEILQFGGFTRKQRELLTIKKTRTISGVAVVAAMTSPERCPHGKCIYCPGGVDENTPQSYTGYEPAALRARMNDYDPYWQVFNRLKQLETIGHDTSKVDLIVMGGTFTSRSVDYQRSFVKGCLDGMNRYVSRTIEESIGLNETSERSCVGLTVETKPDWFFEREIDLALSYGATKVELGVQIVNERVLRLNNRGHGVKEIVRATTLARDAGLKIVFHLMPGMFGASPDDDQRSIEKIFGDERFKPDMLKIYPTLVTRGTALYRLWKEGKYVPPDTEEMVEFLRKLLERTPPWVRIQRVQRDIPIRFIAAGVKRSDIRALAEKLLEREGVRSMEIRFREVRDRLLNPSDMRLVRRDYLASGGREIFLSYESDIAIAGFLRLRIPSESGHRQELLDSSVVRELKVFGKVVPVGLSTEAEWQHRGYGRKLMEEAERITRDEFDLSRIGVISGIGVRNYFRKIGYDLYGPYMVKGLNP